MNNLFGRSYGASVKDTKFFIEWELFMVTWNLVIFFCMMVSLSCRIIVLKLFLQWNRISSCKWRTYRMRKMFLHWELSYISSVIMESCHLWKIVHWDIFGINNNKIESNNFFVLKDQKEESDVHNFWSVSSKQCW